MKRLLILSSLVLLCALFAVARTTQSQSAAAQPEIAPVAQPNSVSVMAQANVEEALQNKSVMFIENMGQFDEDARFHVYGGDLDLWLANDALWITLLEAPTQQEQPDAFDPEAHLRLPSEEVYESRQGVNLKLSFVDANPQPEIEPFNLLETKMNYFKGSDSNKWRSNVPVYGGVRYKDIYPGIDLELTSENGQSVQQFVANSHANLDAVQLRVEGAEEMELLVNHRSGETVGLTVKTAIGDVTLPLFGLVAPNKNRLNSSHTPILNNNQLRAPFAFAIQEPLPHIPNGTLGTLSYSTFIGGSSFDYGYSVKLDRAGNAVVTGNTESSDFPTTPGSYDITNSEIDAFVLKLSSMGDALIYGTFIGGSSSDDGRALALDDAGNVVLTGRTGSSDFPTTAGSYQTSKDLYNDVFVLKLSSMGDALIYSTFVGGSLFDHGLALALDSAGNAIVTGDTWSTDFPVTANSYDTTHNGGKDVFVFKLNSAGDTLLYNTFLGGLHDEYGLSLALDNSDNPVITGWTASSDFPTTENSYDATYNDGEGDGYVFKLNSVGNTLLYSTFIGGSGYDYAASLALDSAGNVVVTGETTSEDFPTTTDSYDTTPNGNNDIFVFKLNSIGNALLYSTFIGGSNDDYFGAIALDNAGNAIVAGRTSSSDFPTTADGYDTTRDGAGDMCVFKLNEAGNTLLYGTFIGGSRHDISSSLVLDDVGNPVITGITGSDNFPTTVGSYDTIYHAQNSFLLKLSKPEPDSSMNYLSGAPGSYFTITGQDFEANLPVSIAVNGKNVGSLQAEKDGTVTFLLSTDNADSGLYTLTISATNLIKRASSSRIEFILDDDAPLRPQEGTGTTFDVPAGIAYGGSLYLPFLTR
ncbi:MAG: SBBP repeat-containing protein [Ardenticatenaceae bacterium]